MKPTLQTPPKKLQVKKETLRSMSHADLTRVVGGGTNKSRGLSLACRLE